MKLNVQAVAIAVLAFGMSAGYASAVKADETQDCLEMVKEHVGVEPSQRVTELCEAGDRQGAMQAAMSGE